MLHLSWINRLFNTVEEAVIQDNRNDICHWYVKEKIIEDHFDRVPELEALREKSKMIFMIWSVISLLKEFHAYL